MTRIAILYCKKIKDESCVACIKCHKAIHEKHGELARYDTIDLAAMTHCGDCPGLTVPRMKLVNEILKNFGREIEVVHLATCMKLAMETAQCPIDFDDLKATLKAKFGVEVVLGTHSY